MSYVIVGNGAASIGAVNGIRRYDTESRIIVVSEENVPTYGRPLISYYLAGKTTKDKMNLRPPIFYEKHKVESILGVRAESLDANKKALTLSNGDRLRYEKLLLATGGKPFIPPTKGLKGPDIYTFTTLADADALDKRCREGLSKVVVIGGGLIGLKAAESLNDRGVSVTIVELASRVLSVAFDETAGSLVTWRLGMAGIDVKTGTTVEQIKRTKERRVKGVVLANGDFVEAEAVVVAIGVVPDTALALDAGLDIDRGILVDERLRTSDPDIFAAGDVAQAKDLLHGDKRNVPIWPNAIEQGLYAGFNMAGGDKQYPGGLSMNSIGFYGLPTASVGLVNPPEEGLFEVHRFLDKDREVYRKLVFQDNRLVGYVLVGDIEAAGVYTGFIRYKIEISPEARQELISGRPSVLLWPEDAFNDYFSAHNHEEVSAGRK